MDLLSFQLPSAGPITDALNATFALLGTLFAGLIGALRLMPWARRRLVTGHLGSFLARGGVSDEPLPRKQRREFRQLATRVAEGGDVSAAEAVDRVLLASTSSQDPWSNPAGRQLLAWCRRAAQPGREPLLGRLVAPEQGAEVRRFIHEVIAYLDAFTLLSPVASGDGTDHREVADFASRISGAAVLVDAAASRSGVASRVAVRHSSVYRGMHSGSSSENDGRFLAGHDPRSARSRDPDERLGDYDGRTVELTGAGLATSSFDGAVALVLSTGESCYVSSEKPEEFRCKGLANAGVDPRLPTFRRANAHWIERPGLATERLTILTSYVSLLCRGTGDPEVLGQEEQHSGPHDVLVLCRRSAATRNGQATLSAAAGGLVELGVENSMDADLAGAPDPVGAAVRECREELGLALDRESISPVSVFVCTVQGRTRSPASSGASRRAGQVVSVVLSLATVQLSFAEIQMARRGANHAIGGFEVDDLVGIAMFPGPAGAGPFARVVFEQSAELDQHGLLSCFYAAVRCYGADLARESFWDAFEHPWWSEAWSGEGDTLRICRDPRQILPSLVDDAKHWAANWEGLRRRLG